MTTTILYRYTTKLQDDADLLARAPLDEFGTIQFVLLVVLVIPVAFVPSAAASHQLLDLALFAPSRNLILHLPLKSEEVSYICLGGRALLEDGHDFVGGHLEPTRKEVESALNPSNGRGRVEGLLGVLKRHDIEPGVVVVRGGGFFS